MHLHWHLIGPAAKYAARMPEMQVSDFAVEPDRAVALPVRGDLLHVRVVGSEEPVWFRCKGRTFNFAAPDGPALRIDLELG